MPTKQSLLAASATIAFAVAFSGTASAVDIWTIGTQDSPPGPETTTDNSEMGIIPAPGAVTDPPYTFDVDTAANPGEFIKDLVGPDEDVAGTFQPNDFNPLTIVYTTDCFLLPGSNAALLIDIDHVFNPASNQPVLPEDEVTYEVAIGAGGPASFSKSGIVSLPGTRQTPSSVTFPNPAMLSITQVQLGEDISVEVTNGWHIGFDYLSLTGDCVTDFGKISGKIGQGRGSYSFSGILGNDTDGNGVGAIEVNYKGSKSQCTFESDGTLIATGDGLGGLASDGDTDVGYSVNYECSGGDFDGATGAAMINLDPGDQTTSNSSNNKDRGAIEISGAFPDAGLNIAPTALDNGNVIVDSDTTS